MDERGALGVERSINGWMDVNAIIVIDGRQSRMQGVAWDYMHIPSLTRGWARQKPDIAINEDEDVDDTHGGTTRETGRWSELPVPIPNKDRDRRSVRDRHTDKRTAETAMGQSVSHSKYVHSAAVHLYGTRELLRSVLHAR